MRMALNLRYQLIPLHYTLAHLMNQPNGLPIFRPLLMDDEFGGDPTAAKLTSQWLDGPSLLAAPCMNEDNSNVVYLPLGVCTNDTIFFLSPSSFSTIYFFDLVGVGWYEFNSTILYPAASLPTTLNLQNIPLAAIPLFVKAGGILTLAPEGMQYSDQLPFGALQVHVYPGRNGAFPLIEDDGTTHAYSTDPSTALRTTLFKWDDASKTLSWTVSGTFSDKTTFQAVEVDFRYFPSFVQLRAVNFFFFFYLTLKSISR